MTGEQGPASKGKTMKSMWFDDSGRLARRWSDAGKWEGYTAVWMPEYSAMQGSYLEPVPDFASHSPFGGPDWFELHWATRSSR